MRTCGIVGCNSADLSEEILYYSMVRPDKTIKEDWELEIESRNGQVIDYNRIQTFLICSLHFESKYFKCYGEERVTLDKDAVPTLFPKDGTQKSVAKNYKGPTHRFQSSLIQQQGTEKKNICHVPQCNELYGRIGKFPLFPLPKVVRNNPELLAKWSKHISEETLFKKDFKICSIHFEPHHIIRTTLPGLKKKPVCALTHKAVPTIKLPSSVNDGIISKSKVQAKISNETQANSNPDSFVFSRVCDTDDKLLAFTGLVDHATLDALVAECSETLIPEGNSDMTIKDRIILTMCKLKTNFSFEQIGVLFHIDAKLAEKYFKETLICMAEIVRHSIYWQTKEQFMEKGVHFENFPQARALLETMKISQCPNLEVLLTFSPNGEISYISDVFSAIIPYPRMFIQTDLPQLLQPNDGLIVGEEFVAIEEVLFENGVELIIPESFRYKRKYKEARARSILQIQKLKTFKIIGDSIDESMIPMIGFIMVVLCGLLNISSKDLIN